MTAQDVIKMAKDRNPEKRFAIADSGNAIGVWSDEYKTFVTCAAETIGGKWAQHSGRELLVNGKRVFEYSQAEALDTIKGE